LFAAAASSAAGPARIADEWTGASSSPGLIYFVLSLRSFVRLIPDSPSVLMNSDCWRRVDQ
jgi:hypothetical protein